MPNAEAPVLKDRFTALDTWALARELRALGRARIDKAFDLPGGGWSLTLRVPGERPRELLLFPGVFAALAGAPSVHSEGLSPLAKELRRLLSGAILQGAADPRSERYLEIHLSRAGSAEITLALEFFGAGNLIVAQGPTIAAVARPRAWAHRVVRVGAEYARPPERTSAWTMGAEELAGELRRSRTDLASTLAARLALGGPIAEELLARAGVPGARPAVDAAGNAAALSEAIGSLVRDLADPPHGFVYEQGSTMVDATPYPSQRWRADASVRESARPRFSEAALEYFRSRSPGETREEPSEEDRTRANLERQRERQRLAIEQLQVESVARIRQGQAILQHYPEAEAAVEERRSTPDPPENFEIDLGGTTVTLWLDRSSRESARVPFDEAKKLQSKLAGARAALQATDARLSQPRGEAAPRARGAAAVTSSKAHWFERFRWFISSDGLVVVAGRDAPSNDLVVRRHLREGDLYLHAEIHGASSVVVKRPQSSSQGIPPLTIDEAGRWAVAFSKAWRAGLASADAFWVTPEQVSKTPMTGEFVARGAWVIHGSKNLLRDLPLQLGIGMIGYDKEEKWTVAPPSALRSRGTLRFLLEPGDERERERREIDLARETGLGRSRLQSLLPAGGLTFRRP